MHQRISDRQRTSTCWVRGFSCHVHEGRGLAVIVVCHRCNVELQVETARVPSSHRVCRWPRRTAGGAGQGEQAPAELAVVRKAPIYGVTSTIHGEQVITPVRLDVAHFPANCCHTSCSGELQIPPRVACIQSVAQRDDG